MKLGAPSLVLAGLFLACSSAIAEAQAPNTAAPVAAATPPAVSAPPAPTDRRRDAHADARVCLEFPTELQVIACAEKYRPARKR
jgi:hypothetical protein